MPYIPGLSDFYQAQDHRMRQDLGALQQQRGALAMRGELQQQEALALKLEEQKQSKAALAQFAATLPPQERLRFMAAPAEYIKDMKNQPRRDALSELSALLTSGGYQGTPGQEGPVPAPDSVALNDAEAIRRLQAAGNTPMRVDVPNPSRVQALAVQAEPDRAIPEILRQQRPAPEMTPYQQQRIALETRRLDQAPPRTEPLVPVRGPDGTPVYQPRSAAIGQPVGSTSIAGSGSFSPETLKFTAQQYLAGDRQAAQGFARSATARIALQEAIREEAVAQGMSPKDVAAKMADYAGTVAGSRTVGQRAANISLAATEAQEMLGIVKETSDKFSRTKFVPWNIALKAYESGTGEPEIAEFGAAVNALVNTYARAINPTGVPTVSDKEHARAVLNTVQSPAQVNAVLGIINRELEIAKKAPATVREATRQGITGGAPAAPAPSSQRQIKRTGTYQGKKVVEYSDGTVEYQ